MKRNHHLLLLLFWLPACFPSAKLAAQKNLHAILLCDTQNPKPDFAASCRVDFRNFRREVDTMAAKTGRRLRLHTLTGADFTRTRLDETVAGLRADTGDVLLFYFSGAAFCDGAISDPKRSRMLRLRNEENIQFADLADRLKAKHARLNVFLVDGCGLNASLSDTVGGQMSVSLNIYQQLFSASGTVTAFASSCSELAICDKNKGGFFTRCFLESLDYYSNMGFGNLNWETLLGRTKSCTAAKAKKLMRRQTVLWFFDAGWRDK